MAAIRILIADDHPISRSGIEFLLAGEPGVVIVGLAEDGDEAVALAESLGPDIVILDLMLPKTPGLVALEHIVRLKRAPRVIAVSGQASAMIFKSAVDLGASAVVSKEDESEELLHALHHVRDGGRYLSAVVGKLIGAVDPKAGDGALTPREREVLALVADGLSNDAIGERLAISPKTAKKHRENIRAKLGISTAVEATQAAARLGLTKLG